MRQTGLDPGRVAHSIQNISGPPQGPVGASGAGFEMRQTACLWSWPAGAIIDLRRPVGDYRVFSKGRRDFIGLLGGAAAAWPLAAGAEQARMPMVGFLSSLSSDERIYHRDAFREGLNEAGYAEGRNVAIEYRYADNRMDQLRPLAEDLIARKVAVIAAVGGNNAALTAKTLTSAIPILFTSGVDPIKEGHVASLNRPEGNVTGVSWFSGELGNKHIELLNELLPHAALIALMVNPNNPEAGFYEKSAQD